MNLTGIPECGVLCLVQFLPNTTCTVTDEACLCGDKGYNDMVTNCVVNTCNLQESSIVRSITATNCGLPSTDRGYIVTILQIIYTILQGIFFFLRLFSRYKKLAAWGPDDTTIVIAWLLQNAFLVAGIASVDNGIGRDVWVVSFPQIVAFLKIFFAFEITFTLTLAIIKSSICFLYLRIFPDRIFRRWLWGTQLFIVLSGGVFVIVDLTQCKPVNVFWETWGGQYTDKCININAMAKAHAIINILLDIWMLVLPATQVWRLNMPTRRKLGVSIMFSFGIFLTIVSMIRLHTLVVFAATQNPTQDFYGLAVWSCIELTTGVIVSCLPASRIVLVKYAPNISALISQWSATINSSKKLSQPNSSNYSMFTDSQGLSSTNDPNQKDGGNDGGRLNTGVNKPLQQQPRKTTVPDPYPLTNVSPVSSPSQRSISSQHDTTGARDDSSIELVSMRTMTEASSRTGPDAGEEPDPWHWRPLSYPPAVKVIRTRWR